MRVLALLAAAFLLAGCSGPVEESGSPTNEPAAAAPEPVDIHEVVNLMAGGSGSWSFDIAEGARSVEVRFYTAGAGVGVGLPICVSWEAPEGSAEVCDGGTNIIVSPDLLLLTEKVYYEVGGGAMPGHYAFQMDAGPRPVDFHAVVSVTY
jgi:hypothetical protein